MGEQPYGLVTTRSFKGREYLVQMKIVSGNSLDLNITDKLTAELWTSNYDATYIENVTHKTGNFKQFDIFVSMLKSGLLKTSECVTLDLLTFNDLEALRSRRTVTPRTNAVTNNLVPSETKRYLIVTYSVEFDRIHYPLPLEYAGLPDPQVLQVVIRRLESEVHRLQEQVKNTSSGQNKNTSAHLLEKRINELISENNILTNQIKKMKNDMKKTNSNNEHMKLLREELKYIEENVLMERMSSNKLVRQLRVEKQKLQDRVFELQHSELALRRHLQSCGGTTSAPSLFHRVTSQSPLGRRQSRDAMASGDRGLQSCRDRGAQSGGERRVPSGIDNGMHSGRAREVQLRRERGTQSGGEGRERGVQGAQSVGKRGVHSGGERQTQPEREMRVPSEIKGIVQLGGTRGAQSGGKVGVQSSTTRAVHTAECEGDICSPLPQLFQGWRSPLRGSNNKPNRKSSRSPMQQTGSVGFYRPSPVRNRHGSSSDSSIRSISPCLLRHSHSSPITTRSRLTRSTERSRYYCPGMQGMNGDCNQVLHNASAQSQQPRSRSISPALRLHTIDQRRSRSNCADQIDLSSECREERSQTTNSALKPHDAVVRERSRTTSPLISLDEPGTTRSGTTSPQINDHRGRSPSPRMPHAVYRDNNRGRSRTRREYKARHRSSSSSRTAVPATHSRHCSSGSSCSSKCHCRSSSTSSDVDRPDSAGGQVIYSHPVKNDQNKQEQSNHVMDIERRIQKLQKSLNERKPFY